MLMLSDNNEEEMITDRNWCGRVSISVKGLNGQYLAKIKKYYFFYIFNNFDNKIIYILKFNVV